jgi:hypothetical protein
MLDYIIGVDVKGKDMFAALVSSYAFLELKFALACPFVSIVYIIYWSTLSKGQALDFMAVL